MSALMVAFGVMKANLITTAAATFVHGVFGLHLLERRSHARDSRRARGGAAAGRVANVIGDQALGLP